MVDVAALADELHDARLGRREVTLLTTRGLDDLADAYSVQERGIALRVGAGESIVGGKLGFTSEAMRRYMGVDHPNYGWLTDAMWIHDRIVPLDDLIHPKVEPEIAFLLEADLEPPVTTADVLEATAAVMPCLEVVDSRYVDFEFTALDNIADNSSAGMLAIGDPVPVPDADLSLLGVVVEHDGELAFTAAGAAAHGHPAAAVAWMANNCDRTLETGHVVISGGLTAPVDLVPGSVVTTTIDRLGSLTIRAD